MLKTVLLQAEIHQGCSVSLTSSGDQLREILRTQFLYKGNFNSNSVWVIGLVNQNPWSLEEYVLLTSHLYPHVNAMHCLTLASSLSNRRVGVSNKKLGEHHLEHCISVAILCLYSYRVYS